MSKIKIGSKAKAVLASFAGINPEMRLRSDYLYVKGTDAGTIAGTFVLPTDEVETEEIALGSVSEFLSVVGMFEEDKLNIDLDKDVIKLGDGKKKITYMTAPLSIIPEKNSAGEKLFEASQEIVCQFVVDEQTNKELNDAIKKLSLGKLQVVCENSKIKLRAINETTDNSIEFDVDGSATVDGEMTFGAVGTFDMLLGGVYAVQIRAVEVNGRKLNFAKMVNSTLASNDSNGKLYYFCSLT